MDQEFDYEALAKKRRVKNILIWIGVALGALYLLDLLLPAASEDGPATDLALSTASASPAEQLVANEEQVAQAELTPGERRMLRNNMDKSLDEFFEMPRNYQEAVVEIVGRAAGIAGAADPAEIDRRIICMSEARRGHEYKLKTSEMVLVCNVLLQAE